MWKGCLCEACAGEEIELEETRPLIVGLVPSGLARAGAQVCHEVIETPKVSQCALKGASDGFGVGEVSSDGQDARVRLRGGEFGLRGAQRCFITACEHDASAFGQKCGSDGLAYAAGAAGDEGDLVLELEVHSF